MTAFSAELLPELVALQAEADAATGDPTLLPPSEGRALAARRDGWWNRDLLEMARAEDLEIPADPELGTPAVTARLIVPETARPGLLVYVHGGGFAFGSPASHDRCARVLALETGLPALLPDYRLAPEHPFPAGLHDTIATLRAAPGLARAAGLAPGGTVVAGDSAGANLALAALLSEIADGRPVPAEAAALFYGVFDADFESPSYRAFRDGPGLTRDKMRRYWNWYLPDPEARATPLAAPARAAAPALAALPPVFLLAAGVDPLLSDTLVLAERLGVEPVVVPGVTHGFLQMSRDLPQARDALAAAAAFIRKTTQEPTTAGGNP
ncbi:alpha/beta hydrolase fold domain-containing protein [Amaricoccus solimangrovi]|uniref:Alpha/beta hydrolase n=1 Tax=Amaricoccus solimangrovi TaxID=2589815 RepID=A0A501WUJ6_9RHOB|nr:alpha/beta hydrolase fold domain-containing protein [Amaricoccus solimangrovi]TPE49526.1 alpha/beta hydrolase [Amaricoccus solimangrovi]